MVDVMLHNREKAATRDTCSRMGVETEKYYLATVHRAGNTDNIERLSAIFSAFGQLDCKVVMPLHPRTAKALEKWSIEVPSNVEVLKPVGYLDFMNLMMNSKKILTDSGGIQKEAYILKKGCITLRDETEWVETVQDGWNLLVGTDVANIVDAARDFQPRGEQENHFGAGNASERIVRILENFCEKSI